MSRRVEVGIPDGKYCAKCPFLNTGFGEDCNYPKYKGQPVKFVAKFIAYRKCKGCLADDRKAQKKEMAK